MTQRLSVSSALLLTVPPLLWAGNAIVGRLVRNDIPPFTLNFLRWAIAFAILLPLGAWVLRRAGGMWPHWRRFALLGLLGVGLYNTLQYLALQTSTALNVTLVASSMPLWMLVIGALFFGVGITRKQLLGAVFSITGVAVVLARGDWTQLLALRLVIGDVFMLAATFCWACYSWLLVRRAEPDRDLKTRRSCSLPEVQDSVRVCVVMASPWLAVDNGSWRAITAGISEP